MKKLLFQSGVLLLLLVLMSASHARDNQYVPVFCDQGHSIQDAVDRATEGALIDVYGTCDDEAVVIRTDRLRIGAFFGQTTNINPTAGTTAFSVHFADNVTIQNFNITGARIGVDIQQGSSAFIFNNNIRESTNVGIVIRDSSYADIRLNLFHSTSGSALQIFVHGNSSANLNNNTITASSGGGIRVATASSATSRFNNISGTLGDSGIGVEKNSHLGLLSPNTVNTIFCGFSGSLDVTAVQTITGGPGAVTLDAGCDLDNAAGDPSFPP